MADESVTEEVVPDTAAEAAAPAPSDEAPIAAASDEQVTSEVTEEKPRGFVTMIEDAVDEAVDEVKKVANVVVEDVESAVAFVSESTKAEMALGREMLKRYTGL